MALSPLGIIPEERLSLMPQDAIPRHEFCFWLHDQTASLLVEASNSGQIEDWHQAVNYAVKAAPPDMQHEEILKLLAEAGGTLCVPMKIDVFIAVLSDTLHFIYEALIAMEKRKFNVAFSLLRKPLTENLIIISRLVASDDEFIRSFADGSLQQKQVTNIDKHERILIFEEAISKIPIESPFSGELLNDIIFNKDMPNGLQIRMQQAIHLITTRHKMLLTPQWGLNRIFADQNGDENSAAYDGLLVVLFFLLQLTMSKLSHYFAVSEKRLNETLLRAFGIFGNMYNGRLDALSCELNKTMKEFFNCEWCTEGRVKIRKKFVCEFYLNDSIYCSGCGQFSHTPLTYILRSGKISIIEESRTFPSEYERLFFRWKRDLKK